LACICESGAAARAAGELGAALAGPIRTDAPIEEKKKSKAVEIALIDVLLNTFFIFSNLRRKAYYLAVSFSFVHMPSVEKLQRESLPGKYDA
jgi:hypothetical protein